MKNQDIHSNNMSSKTWLKKHNLSTKSVPAVDLFVLQMKNFHKHEHHHLMILTFLIVHN